MRRPTTWPWQPPGPPAPPPDAAAALPLLRLLWLLCLGLVAAPHPALAPLAPWLWLAALAGLGLTLLELLLALLKLTAHHARLSRAHSDHFAITLPNPRGQPAAPPAGDLFRTLHGLLAHEPSGSPWIALTIGAASEHPAGFGAAVGAADRRTLARLSSGLHRALSGIAPEAVITSADPLPGADALLARTFAPALPPEYLLLAASEQDLLGPLLTALRPRHSGVRYAELHITLQAEPGWNTGGGWRLRLRRRLALLRAQTRFALSDEPAAIEAKLSEPAFLTTIRAVVAATDRQAALAQLDAIGAALRQLSAARGLRTQRLRGRPDRDGAAWLLRAPRAATPPRLLLPLPVWRGPAPLCAAELNALWHLPGAALAELTGWLACREIAAPAHAFVPADAAGRITVGHARRSDGSWVPVGPALRDLRTILHITAGMGTGKSRLLANICAQLFETGFTLLDGKGDDAGSLGATVLTLVPPEREGDVALLDIADAAWPLGLNPLAAYDAAVPGATDRLLGQIQGLFARVDPETWAGALGMQQLLDAATRLVLNTVELPNLADVRRVLADEAFRATLLKHCTLDDLAHFWRETYAHSSEQQRSSGTALLRRFDRLLGSELLGALLGLRKPTFGFDAAIAARRIVIVPLPHVTYGPLAATAAMLAFQLFVRAAFARPGSGQQRADYPLIVDEFQVLAEHGAAPDVAAALSQLRSLGIPAVYAHQTLGQLGELTDLMLVNAENRVVLRTQDPDASVYARHYAAAGLTAADISGQEPNTHQYARLSVGGQPAGPFSMRPLPWPEAPQGGTSPRRNEETKVTKDASDLLVTTPDAWQLMTPHTLGFGQTVTEQERNASHHPLDTLICQQMYREPFSEQRCDALAAAIADEWSLLNRRWTQIAAAQRQALLANPALCPDRAARIRWLSRLAYARPRLLAQAEIRRGRRASST